MGTLILQTDEDLDLWLNTLPNKSETTRNALRLYKGAITPDTVQGLRIAYVQLDRKIEALAERFTEQYELVEGLKTMMEEVVHRYA